MINNRKVHACMRCAQLLTNDTLARVHISSKMLVNDVMCNIYRPFNNGATILNYSHWNQCNQSEVGRANSLVHFRYIYWSSMHCESASAYRVHNQHCVSSEWIAEQGWTDLKLYNHFVIYSFLVPRLGICYITHGNCACMHTAWTVVHCKRNVILQHSHL